MPDVKDLIQAVQSCHDDDTARDLYDQITESAENDTSASNSDLLDLTLECLSNGRQDTVRAASKVVQEINWSKLSEGVTKVVEQLMEGPNNLKEIMKMKNDKQEDVFDAFVTFSDSLRHHSTDYPAGVNAGVKITEYINFFYNGNYSGNYHAACLAHLDRMAAWETVSTSTQLTYLQLIEQFLQKCKKDSKWMAKPEQNYLFRRPPFREPGALIGLESFAIQMKPDGNNKQVTKALAQILKICSEQELTDRRGKNLSMWGKNVSLITVGLSITGNSMTSAPFLTGFVDDLNGLLTYVEPCLDRVRSSSHAFLLGIMRNVQSEAEKNVESYATAWLKDDSNVEKLELMEACISNQQTEAIRKASRFGGEFAKRINTSDASRKSAMMSFCQYIAPLEPKVFKGDIERFESLLTDSSVGLQALSILRYIAKEEPSAFVGRGGDYPEKIKGHGQMSQSMLILAFQIYQCSGRLNQKECERVTSIMERELRGAENHPHLCPIVLSIWSEFANGPNIPVIQKRKPYIQKLAQIDTAAPYTRPLLDTLEGRTLRKLDQNIRDTQNDMDDTEDKLGRDINSNRAKIIQNGSRIDDVEDRVDDAENDIDELSTRTVSNAPSWSFDVSQLLNRKADNDYRLVAQRLGYKNNDIRGWATQPNPTMSMLAEFYSTNKTSEATHFLLTVLKDVNRSDAAQIIIIHQKRVVRNFFHVFFFFFFG